MRDDECDSFLEEACSCCKQHYINVCSIDDIFVRRALCGPSQCNPPKIISIDLFYSIMDLQIQELNSRFQM